MVRRTFAGFGTLLALPLALFSAAPTVQWCSGPAVPLSPEAFAACLISEIRGCAGEVAGGPASCEAASCEAASRGAAVESPSCPPSLACEDAARVREGDSGAVAARAEGPGSADAARTAPAPPDRAFCVGGPAGGPGLRPSIDDDSPFAELLAASLAGAVRPIRDAGVPLAPPPFEPIPDPPEAATPIRGPPRA